MNNPAVLVTLILAECILAIWGLGQVGVRSELGTVFILAAVLSVFSELVVMFGKSADGTELRVSTEY